MNLRCLYREAPVDLWGLCVRHAVATCALLVASSTTSAAPAVDAFPPRAAHPMQASGVWDDGQAEYSLYDVTGPKEHAVRRYRATMIVVKEDMDLAQRVKSDTPADGRSTSVLKLNLFYMIPTGTYSYHQMLSIFMARSSWWPLKLAASSQDGCGVTFVEALPRRGALMRVAHSYWDGEADRADSVDFDETTVLADGLPLWLRGFDLGAGGSYRIKLVPSQVDNRLRPLAPRDATLEFRGMAPVPNAPLGIRRAWRVDVVVGAERESYWFDPERQHEPVRMVRADGTVYTLRRTRRLAYWRHTAPEDARLAD
jgi:hypothetical protein